VAILEERKTSDRAEEIRLAQKIKSGLTPELKLAIQTLTNSIRSHPISDAHLQNLIDLKLVRKKFGRYRLTSLGKVVSMI
jgi:predicted transcriptional regulator